MAPAINLFNGTKFWLSNRTPSKARFIDEISKHGGVVVPLERMADMLIVDHMRKDNILPNSYSYRYIDLSIRNAQLEEKEDHLIQTQALSAVGAGHGSFLRQHKSTRTAFTDADDIILFQWMIANKHRPRFGNAIFQELAAQNSRHTAQSWRDRWVKKLQYTASLDVETPAEDVHSNIATTDHQARDAGVLPVASMMTSTSQDGPVGNQPAGHSSDQPSGRPDLYQERARFSNNLHPSTHQFEKVTTIDPDPRSRNGVSDEEGSNIADTKHNHKAKDPQSTNEPNMNVDSKPFHKQDLQEIQLKAVNSENRNQHTPEASVDKSRSRDKPANNRRVSPHVSRHSTSAHPDAKIAKVRGPLRSESSRSNTPYLRDASSLPMSPRTETRDVSGEESAATSNLAEQPPLGRPGRQSTPSEPSARISGQSNLPGPGSNHDVSENESDDDFLDLRAGDEDVKNEETAIVVWKKLLRDFGIRDGARIDDSAALVANIEHIQALSADSFEAAWENWWRTNPHRTEQEWLTLFNEHCVPFYKAHEYVFRKQYKVHLRRLRNLDRAVSDIEGNDNQNDGLARGTGKEKRLSGTVSEAQRRIASAAREPVMADTPSELPYQASLNASPELGSNTQRNPRAFVSPELGTNRKRQLLTPDSPNKRARERPSEPPSEIPESPKLKDITNISQTRQRQRNGYVISSKKDNREIPASPEIRYTQRSRPVNDGSKMEGDESDEDNELPAPSKTTWPSSRASQTTVANRKTAKRNTPLMRLPSESLSEPHDQAQVDRQLWSEEAEAEAESLLFVPDDDLDPEEGVEQDDFDPPSSPPTDGDATSDYRPDSSDSNPRPPTYESLSRSFLPHITTGISAEQQETEIDDSESKSTGEEDEEDDDETDIEERLESAIEWLERKREQRHDDEILIMILNAVTMDVRIASKTLQYFLNNRKLPKTRSGVWTAEDDDKLVQHSRMAKRALIKKHGEEAIVQRKKHLELLRAG